MGRRLLLALAAMWAAMPATAAPVIRIATEGTYRPWNYVDAHGSLAGFDIDVAHDICRRLAAVCTIDAQDWSGMIPSLKIGKYDAVIACMSITPARLQAIAFSIPYAMDYYAFVARRGLPPLPDGGAKVDIGRPNASVARLGRALRGWRIGVISADSTIPFFDRYVTGSGVHLSRYVSAEMMQLDFQAGRIDAALTSLGRAHDILRRPEMADFRVTGPTLYGDVLGQGIGVGIAPGRPDLKRRIDAAVRDAIRDGTIRRLSLKWMRADLSPLPS